MMSPKPFRLGTVAGAPIWVHPLALIAGPVIAIPCAIHDPLAAAILSFVLFLSILAHEIGHALAARWFGLHVETIHHIGVAGFCLFEDPGRRAGVRCAVAAAGPFANFLIVCSLLPLAMSMNGDRHPGSIVGAAVTMNVALCVGNLLPIVPLDGSQILFALLWRRWSERTAALVTCAAGLVLAVPAFLFAMVLSIVGFPVALFALPSLNRDAFRMARNAGRDRGGGGDGSPAPPDKPLPLPNAEADRLMAAILAEQSRRNVQRKVAAVHHR